MTIDLIRTHYEDFGPTLAAEKLRERHEIQLGVETVRRWMLAEGLWQDRRQRLRPVHQPRYRRHRVGELVQIDGSTHHWFEDRGPECTLLAYVDDATSRLQHAAFVQSESAFDYMRQTKAYIGQHGRPIAFYSDKHAIFRVNNRDATGGDGMTQFGRALHELNIDIICANTPSAKGRIERSFGTLQDRLVKELRLEGISTVEAANVFLGRFLTSYNEKFGKDPHDAIDSHRPVSDNLNLDDALAWKEEAHRFEQPDAAIRQNSIHARAAPRHAPPRPSACHGNRLPRRLTRHQTSWIEPALSDFRQVAESRSGHDRRE